MPCRNILNYLMCECASFALKSVTNGTLLCARTTTDRLVADTAMPASGIERVYLISSQSRAQANPEQLLALNRGHWGIENRLHHVRDMGYDEDRCRSRKGNAPRTLACLRNFAISLLRLHPVTNIKAALRALAAQADKVLEMLHL
jgi:predicted transposase YbfD/YdcC